MASAKVELSEYSSDWPEKFEKEKEFLINILGDYVHGAIEHVGSTAVSGLTAKPVIDVMVGVESLEASRGAIKVMQDNGYVYFPYRGDVMHWFCKPSDAFRTHHIHLVPYESPLWHDRIAFRDTLRTDTEIADAYVTLKEELAQKYENDREAYTVKKGDFVQGILKRINNK